MLWRKKISVFLQKTCQGAGIMNVNIWKGVPNVKTSASMSGLDL